MEYGINFVLNLHLLITTHGKISRFSESEKPVVSNMSKIFTAEKALKIYDTLSEIQTSLPRNANIKILLYAQTLQMTRTLRM